MTPPLINAPPTRIDLAAALRGNHVVEWSSGIAGAQCGQALAGLGARVTALRTAAGPAAAFDGVKSVVVIDPATPDGFEALVTLCAQCDVFIEERAPLGWPAQGPLHVRLRQRLPRLFVVCLTPYGLTGPYADLPAYPLNCYHAGGNAQQIPCDLLHPEYNVRPPLQAGGHWGEAQAGTQAAIVATACLLHGARYAGLVVDCSKQEALISYNWTETARFPNEQRSPTRLAPLATIVGGILPARDGHVQVAVREDHQWAALAQLLGHDEWITDARWATRAARTGAAAAVAQLLAAETVRHAKLELHRRGRERGVPIAAVLGPAELLADPDLAARGAWRDDATTGARVPRWDTQVHSVTPAAAAASAAPPSGATASPVHANQPLAGVRVLDFGWVAMGPYAGYVLAALGAEVIHVGRPPAAHGGGVDLGHYNYGFDTLNTGKTWVGIDLKSADGSALVRRLAAQCDVVLDNFRPGVTRRLGIDYASLAAINPRLVVLSATTYGHAAIAGPYIGYAPVFAALAGLAHCTGHADGPPAEVSHPVDFYAGSVGVLGLLAGLHRRARTGTGCHIDLAAREAVLWSLGHDLIEMQRGRCDGARRGNADAVMAPHGVYPCAGSNRWLSIAVGSDAEWQRLCAALGDPALATDGRFATAAARRAARDQLDARIGRWTRGLTLDAAFTALRAARVAAFPSSTSEDLWNNPQLRARDVFQARDDAGTTRWYVTAPWRFSGAPRAPLATRSGQAALDAVLGDLLGVAPAERAGLLARGAVALR